VVQTHLSGTSTAVPHVAGATAFYILRRRGLPPAATRQRAQYHFRQFPSYLFLWRKRRDGIAVKVSDSLSFKDYLISQIFFVDSQVRAQGAVC
jgi:hypothetical protein